MLLVDGARVCRGLLNPRRCVFPGGVGMAEMATVQWNKLFRSLLRPGDVPLRRHRRGCGNRPRSWLAAHRLQVMLLLLFFCKEAELSVDVVVAAWPDLALFPPVAMVVGGELKFGSWRSWGDAPVDG